LKGNTPELSIVAGCFSLDYPNYRILEYFTRYGQASRKTVGDFNSKFSPYLSDKQTGRRIENLVELGFLQQVGTKNIRNLKNKLEILYDLTFKGFLASLIYTKLDDTILFRRFLEFIDTVDKHQAKLDITSVKIKPIKPYMTIYVQYAIEFFLSLCYVRGLNLSTVNDIPYFMDIITNNNPFLGLSKEQIKPLQKLQDKSTDAYSQIDLLNDPNSEYYQELFSYFYYWPHTIDLISQGFITDKVISKLKKDYPSEFLIRARQSIDERFESEWNKTQKELAGRV